MKNNILLRTFPVAFPRFSARPADERAEDKVGKKGVEGEFESPSSQRREDR